jgi:hypothetical protein
MIKKVNTILNDLSNDQLIQFCEEYENFSECPQPNSLLYKIVAEIEGKYDPMRSVGVLAQVALVLAGRLEFQLYYKGNL